MNDLLGTISSATVHSESDKPCLTNHGTNSFSPPDLQRSPTVDLPLGFAESINTVHVHYRLHTLALIEALIVQQVDICE